MINTRLISIVSIIKAIHVYIALHFEATKKRLFCCFRMELIRIYGTKWVSIRNFTILIRKIVKLWIFAGQTALNLARDSRMIQILSVKSARKVEKTVHRLEGTLLRRSRFLGWRSVWVISQISLNFHILPHF